MAKCKFCKKEMRDFNTISCDEAVIVFPDGSELKKIPYENEYDIDRCHDCNVLKGQYHHPGCDMEKCPNCKEQIISCGCLDDKK